MRTLLNDYLQMNDRTEPRWVKNYSKQQKTGSDGES